MRTIKSSEAFVNAFNKKFGNKFDQEPVFIRDDDRVILKEGSCVIFNVEGIECDTPIFDYYNEDYSETLYRMNVLKVVDDWVNKVGWWSEAENPGSLQFLPNSCL